MCNSANNTSSIDFTFLACSGAKIPTIIDQANALAGGQQLITVSAGGNDASVIDDCVFTFKGFFGEKCYQTLSKIQLFIYTITPNLNRAPPPNMALGHCESKYKFLWATFDVYGGVWADSDYGGSPGGLMAHLRGCGAVTGWNFEYYDTPAKDGTEWHAWGRLPIGTKGCVGRAVTSSGGFGGGCG